MILTLTFSLLDINECSAGTPCGQSANCINTGGNYYCQCKPGFYSTNSQLAQSQSLKDGTTCTSKLKIMFLYYTN